MKYTEPIEVVLSLQKVFCSERGGEEDFWGLLCFTAGLMVSQEMTVEQIRALKKTLEKR